MAYCHYVLRQVVQVHCSQILGCGLLLGAPMHYVCKSDPATVLLPHLFYTYLKIVIMVIAGQEKPSQKNCSSGWRHMPRAMKLCIHIQSNIVTWWIYTVRIDVVALIGYPFSIFSPRSEWIIARDLQSGDSRRLKKNK